MAYYEKQVEQEDAYPIPISLYNCYRTVRHEKRGIAILLIAFLMPHCPVIVVQRYRDGVCSLLFFIICHPYSYPPSFRRNDFLHLFYMYVDLPSQPSFIAKRETFVRFNAALPLSIGWNYRPSTVGLCAAL